MKKFKTVLIVFCALVYCFAVIKANFFTVSAGLKEPADTPSVFDDDPSWNLLHSLTEDQCEKFKVAGLIDEYETQYWSLEIATKLGKTDGRLHRMTLQEVKEIIELNKADGSDAIFKAIVERQTYPDIDYCGGVAYYLYFLNDEKTEVIYVYRGGKGVQYAKYDSETNETVYEDLYSAYKQDSK